MAGMVGSRMGWVEVPYVSAPIRLTDLAGRLAKAGEIAGSACWIVPGVNMDDDVQPEVMRGEECQMLGALLQQRRSDGVFLTPGTPLQVGACRGRKLLEFRTYITGEMFNLLRQSGTLAQLMTGEGDDTAAFAQGVKATAGESELLNRAVQRAIARPVQPPARRQDRQLCVRHAGRHGNARCACGLA
jgi:2-dehydro-3-deoxygalactonokinase